MIKPGRSWKYVEEDGRIFRGWFIFGKSKNGLVVDLADSEGDVAQDIPILAADRLLKARNKFLAECETITEEIRSPSPWTGAL